MSRKIILIGGAPTTGKSTIAQSVAKHFDIPWISTDQIREIMRVAGKRKDSPNLYSPEGYTAERFLTEFTAEQIVTMEMEQGDAVWPGITKLIQDDYTWEEGFVIEGIHIFPHLVTKDFKKNVDVRAVFIVDEDTDRMREIIFKRGLWDDADKYSDGVKEKEVEWVSLFSYKLKKEVEEYGYSLVEVTKNDNDLNAVLKALGTYN